MKKKVLKLTFLLSAVTLIFSSCLGDGDNKVELQRDFIYITTNSNTYQTVAIPYSYPAYCDISGTPLASLRDGDCAIAGYKIIGTQTKLEEVNVIKTFPTSEQAQSMQGTPPEAIPGQDAIYPNSLSISSYWHYDSAFGDRWLFAPNVTLSDGEKIGAIFYYDPNNQVDDNSTPLTKNRAIIDIRFYKYNIASVQNPTARLYDLVADLQPIRQYLKNEVDFEGQEVADFILKFRYRKPKPTDPFYEGATLGTFSATDPRLRFYKGEQ